MKRILLSLLTAGALSQTFTGRLQAQATVPARINYQAYVTDDTASQTPLGNSTPTNYDVTFKIYNTPTGSSTATAVWAEKQTVTISKGRFSVMLGEGTAVGGHTYNGNLAGLFGTSSTATGDLSIGITVNTVGQTSASEFPTRQRLVANPLAMRATSAQVADSVAAGSINAAAIASGGVGADELASNSVLTAKLSDSAVTGAKLAGSSVNSSHIVDSSITSADILDGTITSADIFDGTITSADISNGTITTDHISNNTITADDILDDTITSGDILDGTVSSFDLASGLTLAGTTTGTFSGNGSALTALNAANLATGTIPDARLGNGIARFDVNGNFNRSGFNLYATRVGIGNASPSYPLHVTWSLTSPDSASGKRFVDSSDALQNANGTYPVSIRAAGYVWAGSGFIVSSDERTKRVVQRADTARDLQAISALSVTDYRMIDLLENGNSLRKGFIAQEVQKVLPEAVNKSTAFIPDIFARARSVTLDATTGTLTVEMDKAHNLISGEMVRVIEGSTDRELRVLEAPDAMSFRIGPVEKTPDSLFVYGRQVNDFLSVDYDRIFTTGIAAIQQLKKEKDTDVQALEAENAGLREKLEAQAARLADLESREAARDAKLAALEKLLPAGQTVPARTVSAGHDAGVAAVK